MCIRDRRYAGPGLPSAVSMGQAVEVSQLQSDPGGGDRQGRRLLSYGEAVCEGRDVYKRQDHISTHFFYEERDKVLAYLLSLIHI